MLILIKDRGSWKQVKTLNEIQIIKAYWEKYVTNPKRDTLFKCSAVWDLNGHR